MGADDKGERPIDERFAVVDEWVKRFSETRLAPEIDRGVLREVLTECGANFDISPELLAKLHRKHYTNFTRSAAMKAVWGERYGEFRRWTTSYIAGYEERTGKVLPALKESGRKNSAMIGFLGELTSYVAGNDETYPFGVFFMRISIGALNGFVREQLGLTSKECRFHLVVPGYNDIEYKFKGEDEQKEGSLPFAPSGFPQEFPASAWKKIKSWRINTYSQ